MAFDLLKLGEWSIEFDRAATVATYQAMCAEPAGPEQCSCDGCRNWVQIRDEFYPQEMRELLDRLGVPLDREVEVYQIARLDNGLHAYGGWFHFVGRIVAGEREWSGPALEAGAFAIGFHAKPTQVSQAFGNLPVIQLEFSTKAPWRLDAPEPA